MNALTASIIGAVLGAALGYVIRAALDAENRDRLGRAEELIETLQARLTLAQDRLLTEQRRHEAATRATLDAHSRAHRAGVKGWGTRGAGK